MPTFYSCASNEKNCCDHAHSGLKAASVCAYRRHVSHVLQRDDDGTIRSNQPAMTRAQWSASHATSRNTRKVERCAKPAREKKERALSKATRAQAEASTVAANASRRALAAMMKPKPTSKDGEWAGITWSAHNARKCLDTAIAIRDSLLTSKPDRVREVLARGSHYAICRECVVPGKKKLTLPRWHTGCGGTSYMPYNAESSTWQTAHEDRTCVSCNGRLDGAGDPDKRCAKRTKTCGTSIAADRAAKAKAAKKIAEAQKSVAA